MTSFEKQVSAFLSAVREDYGEEVASECKAILLQNPQMGLQDIGILTQALAKVDCAAYAQSARLNATPFNSATLGDDDVTDGSSIA